MKFFVAIAALTSLAVAAPAAVEAGLDTRQTYPGCNTGMKPGDYSCFDNIVDKFEYLGQCGTDGNIHVSNYCVGNVE
jgi:hypothetical protein